MGRDPGTVLGGGLRTVLDDDSGTGLPWRLANLVLGVLALALLATCVLLWTRGSSAQADEISATRLSRQQAAVSAAARAEATAFLAVDHRDMAPLVARVLAGATGGFAKQYAAGRRDLIASTEQSLSRSRGKVLRVGVTDLAADRATVLVAADAQVSNRATRGATQPRLYRLRLTLDRVDGRWLTSDLQFVG
jgi:Mce-associated membrane protein